MPWLDWYNSLAKPTWTPAPATIGLIWQILYPVIVISFGFVFVQGRSIIDAISSHRHLATLGFQRLDSFVLVFGSHSGVEFINPKFLGHGSSCLLVITREHDDSQA